MDWEDKEGLDIQTGEVSVYHEVFGETIIKENLFDKVLYDYAVQLLKVYHDDKSLPLDWTVKIEKSLKLLWNKIESDSS